MYKVIRSLSELEKAKPGVYRCGKSLTVYKQTTTTKIPNSKGYDGYYAKDIRYIVGEFVVPRGALIVKPHKKVSIRNYKTGLFKDVSKYRTNNLKFTGKIVSNVNIYDPNEKYIYQPLHPTMDKFYPNKGPKYFSYKKNLVKSGKLNEDIDKGCASGLHFFTRKIHAERWD